MTLAERINAMPKLEEPPTLRKSPFTLVEEPHGLSKEECDHLAFCERHDFKAHEKEVAACIETYRKLRDAGDLMARAQLERAKSILDHLLDMR